MTHLYFVQKFAGQVAAVLPLDLLADDPEAAAETHRPV